MQKPGGKKTSFETDSFIPGDDRFDVAHQENPRGVEEVGAFSFWID
jgi:hypothetical protein